MRKNWDHFSRSSYQSMQLRSWNEKAEKGDSGWLSLNRLGVLQAPSEFFEFIEQVFCRVALTLQPPDMQPPQRYSRGDQY